MAERFARPLQEGLLAVRLAQRVGAHDAHALGLHVAQALAEALETFQRARGHGLVDAALVVESGRQAHHLAQPVEDRQLAVRVARHHHVKAVRSQIDGRNDVGDLAALAQRRYRLNAGTGLWLKSGTPPQTLKDEPQPQVVAALGLRMTNCAPSRSSR